MPVKLAEIGSNLLQGLGNAIFGIGMGAVNDKRQIKQQGKLQELQIKGQKEMTDYQMAKQLQMWKDTNYSAQIEQMEAAGLNPGLIYGMGGSGGTTTGSATGNVTGGQAPSGGGEIGMAMQLGMQRQMQQAQVDLIKAQTENVKADTVKKSGPDTENVTANTRLTNIQSNLAQIEAKFKSETYRDSVNNLKLTVDKSLQELNILKNEAIISENTWSTQIEMVENEALGIILRNTQTRAQTNLTEAQITKIAADIRTQVKQLEQTDRALDQEDQHILIQKVRNTLIEKGIWVGAASHIAGDIIDIFKPRKTVNLNLPQKKK